MAEFTEVMKQKSRMCKSNIENCLLRCPMYKTENGRNMQCASFMSSYPQEAESIIMDWAKEHPVKINIEKFTEIFGFKPALVCP